MPGNRLSPFAITLSNDPCAGAGSITREQWSGVLGNDVVNIPLQTSPSSISQLTLFEAPSNIGYNYGARVRGYICPPQTGNYTFWIAADDASELWLSTDDNPANKVRIAYNLSYTNFRQWDKYASQKSVSVYLRVGYRYYVEALHKQGYGSDNLAVAWQLPDGTLEAPMPGNRLIPYTVGSSITSITSSQIVSNSLAGSLQEISTSATLQTAGATLQIADAQLSVSPNPVSDNAVIDVRLKEMGRMKLDLLDQQGRIVKQITNGFIADKTLNQRFPLYTAGLSSGIYIVRMVTPSGIMTKKVVVEK